MNMPLSCLFIVHVKIEMIDKNHMIVPLLENLWIIMKSLVLIRASLIRASVLYFCKSSPIGHVGFPLLD